MSEMLSEIDSVMRRERRSRERGKGVRGVWYECVCVCVCVVSVCVHVPVSSCISCSGGVSVNVMCRDSEVADGSSEVSLLVV